MRQTTTRILGTALATLVLIASAYANSVNFMPGNHPQANEEEILFNTAMTGNTITGHTNQTHAAVDFTSMGTVLSGKGGQSDIDAESGLIHDITITMPGFDFKDYIFNATKPTDANNIIVDVFLTDGTEVTDNFNNNDHGQNFLTIVATGSALIDKITITSSGGFASLDHNRVSGVAAVPEPSSPLLLGCGLLGFVPMLRRKKLS